MSKDRASIFVTNSAVAPERQFSAGHFGWVTQSDGSHAPELLEAIELLLE